MTLSPGLHPNISMRDYLELDAIGSGRLGWLAVSPKHYRYMCGHPRAETDATALGTALHAAVLEPGLFRATYIVEPDPREVAPNAIKPRATSAYKDECAKLVAAGRVVLKIDEMAAVLAMRESIWSHPHAVRLLDRAPEREVSFVWDQNGRCGRGRADMLGDGILGDLKSTRSLRGFSPWEISSYAYHRQAGLYTLGLEALGCKVQHVFFIAVESTPPFDVGVFALEPEALRIGQIECEQLLAKLDECEASGVFPGMFPNVVPATISDRLINELSEVA